MYNTRKCPRCGGNVPEGNEICNNCGHKMSFFGSTSMVSVKKSQNDNPFVTSKNNNSGCFVIFIILLFFVAPFISFVYEMFEEFDVDSDYYDYDYDEYEPDNDEQVDKCFDSCSGTYMVHNGYCVCDNGSIYYSNGTPKHMSTGFDNIDANARCALYCEQPAVIYDGAKCPCSDGTFYDLDANLLDQGDLNNLMPNNRTIDQWLVDVKKVGDVVTVICDSKDPKCPRYREEMDNLAANYEYNYYFFNLDLLHRDEIESLTKTFNLYYYESSDHALPYTFVVRNGKFLLQLAGRQNISYIESTFRTHAIIKE